NTVYVTYRIVADAGEVEGPSPTIALLLRPQVHFRAHNAPVDAPHPGLYQFNATVDRYEISVHDEVPPLRLTLPGHDAAFMLAPERTSGVVYGQEAERGDASLGALWSPGYFQVKLSAAEPATL